MTILYTIFFFGLAMALVVAKGIFMSREFAARSREVRLARLRNGGTSTTDGDGEG